MPADTRPVTASLARPRIDSRPAYASFAGAFILGHGSFALSQGPEPQIALPGWVPLILLAVGIVPGVVLSFRATGALRVSSVESEAWRERMLGTSWATGFVAIALAITGLASTLDAPEAQSVMWPAGAAGVVGMINIAEGVGRRNQLHYMLGSWLVLVAGGALLLPTPGPFWVLSLAGGGGYLVAIALERRRLRGAT